MARIAAQASAIHAFARLLAAAKSAMVALGRRPTTLATMDDRMLRDIGLSRHDLWQGTPDPLFRAPSDFVVPLGLGGPAPGRTALERRSHQALTRVWAKEVRSA